MALLVPVEDTRTRAGHATANVPTRSKTHPRLRWRATLASATSQRCSGRRPRWSLSGYSAVWDGSPGLAIADIADIGP